MRNDPHISHLIYVLINVIYDVLCVFGSSSGLYQAELLKGLESRVVSKIQTIMVY